MNPSEPTLRVQINQIDHCLVQPGPLDNSTLPRVPVIRIYGASSTGKKACVHVHQVYPYFFVEYSGELNPDHVNRYTSRLARSLNHALAISMKRNPQSSKSQFVRAIILVKGVHFYGFHSSYSPFLKIIISDPALLSRTVTIIQSGTVMQTRFRVFESHLGYILQFMSDFGLYGCGWLDLGEVLQRGNEDVDEESGREASSMLFRPSPHFRQSRMSLEVDVSAHQILNRRLITARNIHHKLKIPAAPLPAEPLVLSVRELWEDERKRRRANGLNPSPDIPVDPSEKSRGTGGDWVAEARWWEEIRNRIERERGEQVVVKNQGWEKWVMTTFESVEALWEEPWKVWKPGRGDAESDQEEKRVGGKGQESLFVGAGGSSWNDENGENMLDVDVDETMLSSQEMSQLVEVEEAEWDKLMGNNDQHLVGGDTDGDVSNNDPLYPDDHHRELEQYGPEYPSRDHRAPSTSDPFLADSGGSSSKRANPYEVSTLRLGSPPPSDSAAHSNSHTTHTTPTQSQRAFKNPVLRSPTITPTKTRKASSYAPAPDGGRRLPRLEAARDLPGSQSNDDLLATSRQHPTRESPSTRAGPSRTAKRHDGPRSLADRNNEETRSSKRRRLGNSQDQDDPRTNSFPSSASSILSGQTSTPSGFGRIPPPSNSRPTSRGQKSNCYIYSLSPPTTSELLESFDEYGIPNKMYRDPYYSKASDAPKRPREYAGLLYRLKGGTGLSTLEDWDDGSGKMKGKKPVDLGRKLYTRGVKEWEYASCPPSVMEVKKWLLSNEGKLPTQAEQIKLQSQIEGPTQGNIYGLDTTPGTSSDTTAREKQNMTVLALEVFAPSRGCHVPDADTDEIVAVFYSFQGWDQDISTGAPALQNGNVVVASKQFDQRRLRDLDMDVVPCELDLLNRVSDIIVDLDPDVIVGWEVQSASWGYLNARGRYYGFDIGDLISRAPAKGGNEGNNQWAMRHNSTFKVAGRHVLNLWRIIRAEVTLNMYTFENAVFHMLQRRTPRYSFSTLTEWYNSPVPAHTALVLRYFTQRTTMVLEILEEAEVVTKNAEFARVFGVDFFSVLSRGSQFKVESFMFRIAKPESFVLLSPSKSEVGSQNGAECMPLIMEPLSAFYNSPLVVLDFQSLYPSIMIAYNYCYSTCLGRVTDFKGRSKFGVTELNTPPGLLETLQDKIHVAPNGIMYVKPEVRKGLLGRMLVELLETRIMVKQAMKGVKEDKALKRILDARQLSLKYICNVTYGYTGATYSGRMPAVEIADSIVQSGRETLEKAIRIIDSTKKWGGKVVYGDTDSVFVYLQGKTKEQAFRIGHDIADTITALNPAPIKLKFEKVYLPCVLMAKKRYVGFKYENPDDTEPVFDAKGIETVRRDGVLAQQKMTEKCLKILFRTQDLSEVKEYCYRSWTKILQEKVSIQDFIFAKEVRMGTYSDKGPPPAGVVVAARRILEDQNDEPQYGDRIPYVIIRGQPNSRLVDRAVAPEELLNNSNKHLDAVYYISRVLIPPLERIFNLVGADVRSWYDEMPKPSKINQAESFSPKKRDGRSGIDGHFQSAQCLTCGGHAASGICERCRRHPQTTLTGILGRVRAGERRLVQVQQVCASCTGSRPLDSIKCESLDCPWLYERKKAERRGPFLAALQTLMAGVNPSPNVIHID